MPTFKVTTTNGECSVEADYFKSLPAKVILYKGEEITAVVFDVQSIEEHTQETPKFKVGDKVNYCGNNGVVDLHDDSLTINFGVSSLYIYNDGKVKRFKRYIQHGHVEPNFKLHDRVAYSGVKGVVTYLKDDCIYTVGVTLDNGEQVKFSGVVGHNPNEEPTLSLVSPNWTGLELEYYNALIEAGASESAADYAVTMTLRNEELTTNFPGSLLLGFTWEDSPWGNTYWSDIQAAIKTPPSVKIQQLLSDKTPEIGDLVIAGDVKGLFWYVGVFTSKNDTFFPYYVQNVGGTTGSRFKFIKCLNL